MNQFSNRRFGGLLTAAMIGALLLVPVGFVLAGDVSDGGVCAADGECKNGKCCCCPTAGCDASHTGICSNTSCSNVICSFSVHTSLTSLINKIVDYIFWIGIVLCPLMIAIGAFLFMASGGDPARATLGKKVITWAVIGLAFILFAKAISGIIAHIVIG